MQLQIGNSGRDGIAGYVYRDARRAEEGIPVKGNAKGVRRYGQLGHQRSGHRRQNGRDTGVSRKAALGKLQERGVIAMEKCQVNAECLPPEYVT